MINSFIYLFIICFNLNSFFIFLFFYLVVYYLFLFLFFFLVIVCLLLFIIYLELYLKFKIQAIKMCDFEQTEYIFSMLQRVFY